MARIDYCDTTKSNERTKEILGKNRNANIFRMMAHSPSYFEQYCRLGGAIRHKGELDPVVRELAITRTGLLYEAPYEVVAHKRIGKNVGVTDEQNAALGTGSLRPASTICSARRSPSPTRSSNCAVRPMRPSMPLRPSYRRRRWSNCSSRSASTS